jgi:antirestriction protein ArdC
MGKRGRKGKPRTDWYEAFTTQIIEQMERAQENNEEWVKPWSGLAHGFPHNGSSERPYSGLNTWVLAMAGHRDPRWYTFRQAKQLGAHVRKGEKGTYVFFWKFFRKYFDQDGNEVGDPSPEEISERDLEVRKRMFVRVYTVFNGSQIEGLPVIDTEPIDPNEGYERAAEIVEALNPTIEHSEIEGASHSSEEDKIRMPKPGQFEDRANYWSTLFHEIVHWTGATTRLNRKLGNRFGSDAYAFEELVAEIGSAMLCGQLGITGELRHPQYLAHWMQRMRQDKFAIFKAATLAQNAVDFVLSGGTAKPAATDSEQNDEQQPMAA